MRIHRPSVSGQQGRIFAGLGLAMAAAGIALVLMAMMATDAPISELPRAEAAPVEIIITSVTPLGGGNFTATGTWSISGGQCWSPGNRFHGYIILYTSSNSSGTPVPLVTFTDNAPSSVGPEDSLSGNPPLLGSKIPAPCNGAGGGISEPRAGDDRDATNVAWSINFTLSQSAFVCAAVLHTQTTGADADATDCTESIIVIPTPTATATNTATATATATNTATATATATNTATATATATDTATATATNTATATATATDTATATATSTATNTATATATSTTPPTSTPTNTSVPTSTATSVPPTNTATGVPTSTSTSVPPTSTATSVPATSTSTSPPEIDFVETATPTFTPTPTLVAQVAATVVTATPVREVQRLVSAGSGGVENSANAGLLAIGATLVLMGSGLLVLSRRTSSVR